MPLITFDAEINTYAFKLPSFAHSRFHQLTTADNSLQNDCLNCLGEKG